MRRLASDTLIYGLGSVANQAVAFLLLPLYTRYLTPADYGTLALIGAAGSVLGLVAALGIHSGLTRVYFLYDTPEDRDAVVTTGLAFGIVTSTLTALSLLVFSDVLAPLLLDVPDSIRYVRLAIVLYSLTALGMIGLSILQIHQRARAYITCTLAGLLTSISLTIYMVAVAGRGVIGVLEGQLAGMIVQLVLSLLLSLPRLSPRIGQRSLREMLAFCVPLLPTNLAAWVLGLADRYALKEYGSFANVGLYSLGYRFGSIFETLFMRPFSLAWPPYVFSILDQPGHREICARVLEYYTVLGGTLVLAVGLLGDEVIRVIATASFFEAGKVIYWIGLGFLLRGSTFITVTGIHVRQKTHYSSYAYGVGMVINLALLLLLVPRFGMMGAAFAVVITYATVSLALWAIAQRIYPMPYRLGRVGALLGMLTGLYLLGIFLAPEPVWLRVPFKLGCLAAFPGLLLVGRFFTPDELAKARALALQWLPGRRPA
ncbi:MAG: oligosaccharide flippase family protein [Deltaproteobacteria bacterium]|nr:oligosaccharide flippase family protein [Deltaproteobacteria bacterium]